jgi:hypothetical protein
MPRGQLPSNVKRRKFLVVSAGSAAAALAGCSARTIIGDDEPEVLEVHNSGENPHTGSIAVSTEDAGRTLVEEPFELDPSAAKAFELSESGPFSITTKLESGHSRPYTWRGGSCPDAPLNVIINGPEAIDYQESACD